MRVSKRMVDGRLGGGLGWMGGGTVVAWEAGWLVDRRVSGVVDGREAWRWMDGRLGGWWMGGWAVDG